MLKRAVLVADVSNRMLRRVREIGDAATRSIAFDAAVAIAALLVLARYGLTGVSDWGQEARPAVNELLAGHVAHFFELAPVYGASLLLRAPFLLATKLWHGGELAIYRMSAVPCLLALGALSVWLGRRMRSRGAGLWARAVVVALCAASPMALSALQFGHAEELLTAVLCIAAVLCALRDRPICAAVLLGLAIADKQWAVLAVGPVLVALPRRRVTALLITGGVAGLLLAPFVLAGHFSGQATTVGLSTGTLFFPDQIWWFFGSHVHNAGVPGNPVEMFRRPPSWLGGIGHSLVIVLMLPLTALYARLRRHDVRRRSTDVLLLFALLCALRCLLDPWDNSYYPLPFLLALLTWEALRFTRPPVITLLATFAAWLTLRETSGLALALPTDTQSLIFTAVAVPAIIALLLRVYAPGVGARWAPHSRRAAVTAAATA